MEDSISADQAVGGPGPVASGGFQPISRMNRTVRGQLLPERTVVVFRIG